MKKGRLIICHGCGKAGGTLERVDSGLYAHPGCKGRAITRKVIDEAKKDVALQEVATKERLARKGIVVARAQIARPMPQKVIPGGKPNNRREA